MNVKHGRWYFLVPMLLLPGFLFGAEAGLADDTVLASHGDVKVTKRDLDVEIAGVKSLRGNDVDPPRMVLFQLVEHMLLRKVLVDEAEKNGLANEQALLDQLQRQREMTISRARMDQVFEQAPTPDLERIAREHYLAHRENFEKPDRVNSAHILIGVDSRSEEEARQLAEEIHRQLLAEPNRFDALARQWSEDKRSGQHGGVIGWQQKAQLVEEYASAAFALEKEGDISAPVLTQFGYHIIKLLGKEEKETFSYEEVKDKVLQKVAEDHRAAVIRDHLDDIKKSDALHYDEDRVQAYFEARFPAAE